MRQILTPTSIALILLLSSAVASFGASLSISPATGNSFTIQGSNMDGVAGIQIDISYDLPFTPGGPQVTPGALVSGALFQPNPNIPGLIRIAIVSTKPFIGSGTVASIAFSKGSGSMRIVSQNMIDSSGSQIAAGTTNDPGFITSPGVPFSQPGGTSTTGSTTTPASSTGTAASLPSNPAYLGTVTMPSDTLPPQPPTKLPAPVEQTPVTVASPPPHEPPVQETSKTVEEKREAAKQVTHVGVLERFRTHDGEKTPATLSALFTREVASAIRQTPAIAVSDGVATVSLSAELPASDVSPNFAINGAKLTSIGKENETGRWVIELLPNKAVFRATVKIMTGNASIIDFPLTIIPPVSGVTFTDKDFYEFMKDSGAAKPKFDLNGDGRHDYVDNYIYTGHYLLQKQAGKTPQQTGTK